MPASDQLNLAVGLPLRNQDELDALLSQLSDPASPNYHQFLTPAEFAARFGPSEADYQSLISFMQSNGLAVTGTHSNRTILDVRGAASDIERVFHVNMLHYQHASRGTFYAPDREPSLDLDLPLASVTGLDNFVVPRPMDVKTKPLTQGMPLATGSAFAGLFLGNDFRAAYAPDVTLTGAGQTVGLFELDGFYASDVAANFKQAGLPAVPTQTVLLDGFSGAPGNANIEVTLDIMMAAYMAPGLSNIIVYEGTNWNDVLNRMATDNLASQLSCSWVFSPINATTEQIFKQYIAQGQSFFQASGDSGAYTGYIWPPADNPNVTSVGGTSLTTAGSGGPWLSETTWTGSGGGVSTTYPIPTYQQNLNLAAAHASTAMRNIPDVALTADVQLFLIQSNGHAVAVGGTSAAAPLWAGFMALANQQAAGRGGKPVGFLNPLIYAIGNGANLATDLHDITTGNNKGYSAISGYDLATGWGTPAGQHLIDDLTGATNQPGFTLSVSAAALSLKAGSSVTTSITVKPLNGFNGAVALSASGLPAGVTASFSPSSTTGSSTLTLSAGSSAAAGLATITVNGASGSLNSSIPVNLTMTVPGFGLSVSAPSLTIKQGGSGSAIVTVSPVNGFSGTVALSVSGLPAGVTFSFSPASTAGKSTLTLSASSSATPGLVTITVNGTSGSLNGSAPMNLTVTVPSFGLAVSAASLTVKQGGSGTTAVTVSPVNGFTGAVALSASGLPAGVTASFSPDSTSAKSTLTLTASTSAAVGPATVTVTGTSGALQASATVNLTVTDPSFGLSLSVASLSLKQTGTGTAVVTVNPVHGFSDAVALAASGVPAGVTASFSPASTKGTSTLKLTTTSSAALGTATITISGTSGNLKGAATLALTVSPGPNFTLAPSSASLDVYQGMATPTTILITPVNGFTGVVNFSASGLPSGVTASFRSTSMTIAAGASAQTGVSTVTVTGTWSGLSHTTTIALTVLAPSDGATMFNPSSVYNVTGMVTDGSVFTNGGLDAGGRAYSANLLGTSLTVGGTSFYLGPANAPDAISAKTLSVSGQYSGLKLLATGVNGNQPSQVFTVTYTDGTKSVFTQSLSDWYTAQNYPGETVAAMMGYRDNSIGTFDGREFALYAYSFPLNAGKTVKSVTLPSNRNVVVLAMTFVKAVPAVSAATKLASSFDVSGSARNDGTTSTLTQSLSDGRGAF